MLGRFTVPNSDERNKIVLAKKQKAVIENDFNEKGWNAYKIWKEHPSFECSRMAVHNLIKKIKETGSTERRKGSGRPVTAKTEENASIFERLVCSQEDEPGTHNSIREITPRISISKSSVHCLVKKNNLHCYKRLKTPQMNSACRKIRAKRAGKLLQRFSIHSLPRLVFQDEKNFSFEVPTNRQNNRVYFNGSKKDVQPERLYSKGNKFSKKVMVSTVITWKGVSQSFFIGGNGTKVNRAADLKHLHDNLFPAVEAMYPNKDVTLAQHSAPSHRTNQVQNYLKQKLQKQKSRFIKNTDWAPKVPDRNSLDYYFWDCVQEKV